MSNQRIIAAALLWSGTLVIAWFAYAPGLAGAFLLDDVPNLAGLASVVDWNSAINFTLSGDAGPLGRPLALATFVPQSAAWESTAQPFLLVNILIHLGNACLLLWMLRKLSTSHSDDSNRTFAVLAAAALWVLMPLLASSSLMIIQRMTTLSASFVLLGLIGYLIARQSIERRPIASLIGMSAALAGGTLFAAFTKENGALLPTFVLVIEGTLLRSPASLPPVHWRTWKSIFLVAPTLIIIAYLVSWIPYAQEGVLKREFTSWERLLTESRILWEYLFNAFIPQPGQFGPFHDGYPVARTIMKPLTFLAFAGWLVALTLAVFWRRRHPLFAFAMLWFLSGHLIESTVVPLELYYEHRNYLPIIGPVYAICAMVAKVPLPRKKLAYAGTTAYALISALVLFSLTSLWGNPSVAFPYWQERFPNSMYAATAAMGHLQATEGPRPVMRSLRRFVSANPEAGYLGIYELKLSCTLNPAMNHGRLVEQLDESLKDVDFSYTALTMLSQVAEVDERVECRGVGGNELRGLARSLLGNVRYGNNGDYNQLHHQFMALTYQYEGNLQKAVQHLRKAMSFKRSNNLNKMLVVTFAASGDFAAAREFISGARSQAPWNPMKRYVWLNRLDELSDYLHQQASASVSESIGNK